MCVYANCLNKKKMGAISTGAYVISPAPVRCHWQMSHALNKRLQSKNVTDTANRNKQTKFGSGSVSSDFSTKVKLPFECGKSLNINTQNKLKKLQPLSASER